jgi:hypothetical protein
MLMMKGVDEDPAHRVARVLPPALPRRATGLRQREPHGAHDHQVGGDRKDGRRCGALAEKRHQHRDAEEARIGDRRGEAEECGVALACVQEAPGHAPVTATSTTNPASDQARKNRPLVISRKGVFAAKRNSIAGTAK